MTVPEAKAQTRNGFDTLSVTTFGARGDAVQTWANTISNSIAVTLCPTNALSDSDVGKLIQLFGAGPVTSGTNGQDLITTIVNVQNGTNLTLAARASRDAVGINCTYGTQNATAFQKAVEAASAINTFILVPAGKYLLVPPSILVSNFVASSSADIEFAIKVNKGGIHFLGAAPDTSALLGNGAWILSGGSVERGSIFGLVGPVTNDAPLIFENLGFDGGVALGNQHNIGGPANPVDGSGWDVTHAAVVDWGPPPLHSDKRFINCRFRNWRGEILKSVVAGVDGFVQVTNCAFFDSEASAFNFNFTHQISGCTFSNLFMAMEFYEGYMRGPSVFENSEITNVVNAIVLVGALTNFVPPPYTIRSNSIASSRCGVLFSPVRNLTITGNSFQGCNIGVGTDDYAYQGSDYNQDILVQTNTFTGVGYVINIASSGRARVANLIVRGNTANGCGRFGNGYGWCTNAVFQANSSLPVNGQEGLLWGNSLIGQYFIDDGSNDFPPFSLFTDNLTRSNTVSYSMGVRQNLAANSPGTFFLLDTAHPERIPLGARLNLVYSGKNYSATLLSSLTNAPYSLLMNPGDKIICLWTNNSWILSSSSTPFPPNALRVGPQ